ncbi:unnamed protein product [Tuber aestivum]|uniref:Uncharacterized protein n=1 Tax=Tuber aestivum TaxID=59557 RepID=A0A292Q6V6_9PEZI|nr:unnamed protein product [Tuber aestivum]
MNTPPRLRSRGRPKTPPAPRHGPKFSPEPERTCKRKGASSTSGYSTATLSPPPSSPIAPHSPEQTRIVKGKKRTTFAAEGPAGASSSEVDSDGDKEGKVGGGEQDNEIEKILGKGRKTLLNPGGFGLPTPAKTPSRKRKHLDLEEIVGSARVLFPSSSKSKDSSSTPLSCARRTLLKKSPPRQRKGGMGSLDLLGDERPALDSISIFTDSNARIPKHDDDPDNPFITRPGEESVTSKRQRIKNKKAKSLGADEDREDGMVYVFRGKKVFKKFTEMEDPNERLPGGLDDGEDDEISLERSAIKPRLLFPPKSPEEPEIPVEEEAETDIEESTSSQPATSFAEALATMGKQEKRDISRLTPDSEDDSGRSNIFNPGGKTVSKRKSIFDAGEDGDEPLIAPVKKSMRRKRGLEDESATLESPRRVRIKRARV